MSDNVPPLSEEINEVSELLTLVVCSLSEDEVRLDRDICAGRLSYLGQSSRSPVANQS